MNKLIETLTNGIKSDTILPESVLKSIDLDNYLDNRDADEKSEEEWNKLNDQLPELDIFSVEGFEELHLLVFQKCTKFCGVSDLSCYTAEDFGFLVQLEIANIKNEWSDNLLKTYINGSLP
ncbi:hypothetical protein LNTAR_12957 [Lentisphaera araneosa HTCC2155]|jgi:hypothetical protein|uniref:Uncharacterized protein n=1 Tax=Lentisphaera araneosa HTCC2155 TaxID=313628 RepID=A6DUH5_9BACT|nr:hypothetical protein [Lentisphaera araneosa]EDM24710.1 hypothetical protein LNTAR_12957 [Lentisphaera araneosa HTCC2155]